MKKTVLSAALFCVLLASCGGGKKSEGPYPANFKSIGDVARVDFIMKSATPDSVARFIIYGALGRNKETPIDSLGIATNHVYESLKGEALDAFSIAYDSLVESLPLADKMAVYKQAGTEDPQRLGYQLGLEYMSDIRSGNKSVGQIEKELKEFRKACGSDTAMYRRFIVGFQTVLKVDHGNDVPEEIYRKFINYQ